tara:strand:+ start:203 stop:658 length:456 start_codon:yes stop_codon:yes gene_type:complete
MTLIPFLKVSTQWLAWLGIGLSLITIISFIFGWGVKYRLIGTTVFTFLLSGSCLAFSFSYEPNSIIEGAKYAPIVYDNGYDLVVAQASDTFPEDAVQPTLRQIAENIKGGVRNGAIVHVRLRQIDRVANGISSPKILGEVLRDTSKKKSQD